MSQAVNLHSTRCAWCGTEGNANEVYRANFDLMDFNPAVFSARRMPDRLHYRMVRCRTCGLLRSDPVADTAMLENLYRQSVQSYGAEVTHIRSSYGRYLDMLGKLGGRKSALLEIGCGSGFVLEEALLRGYGEVWGIEPSAEAAARAAPGIREHILRDVLRPGLLPDDKFDAICMFQVFDHLPDPNGSLDICCRLLKPGAMLLALNHDEAALPARLLGEKSPIIDIEHTYLYSRKSIAAIFARHGLDVMRVGAALNHYSLQYLAQLMPLPRGVKQVGLRVLETTRAGRLGLTIGLGNLFIVAKKPG